MEEEPKKVMREEKERELWTKMTETVPETETAKNKLLTDIKKDNLGIEEIDVLKLILKNFTNVKTFKNNSGTEDEEKSKTKKEKKPVKKNDLSLNGPNHFAKVTKIKQIILRTKEESTSGKYNDTMVEKVEENLNKGKVELQKRTLKVIVKKSDFMKILIEDEGLPLSDLKKVLKRKGKSASDIIQKKAKKEDCLSNTNEIEKEKDDEEFELSDYVEHDKKYFFVHLAKISCKICSFKGKPIVHHYRMKHPDSEVLISRINPGITEILIKDAIQNQEKYDKNHPKIKTKCSFKCPFCLVIIKNTPKAYYNHISSHTGEYRFRCEHCSFWTYNCAQIRTHLNKMHYKIHKSRYKMVYPDPKLSKYVFGYICSECYFIQLIREKVEEHAMVYHPGSPDIHRVNLGMLLNEAAVDENTNYIHSNENHSNLNDKELSVLDLPSQIKELEKIKVEIGPNVLESDPCPIELPMFICQPDLDIKPDSESDMPPHEMQDEEEALSSKVKLPVISSVQSLASKTKPLVLMSGNHPKRSSVLTNVSMTDIKKQNKKCPKAIANMMKPSLLRGLHNYNLTELVPPYNCEDDGFPNCSFKTLYFDEYLKHVEVIHQINGLGSFSYEHEVLRGAIMEGWLAKEVGPFQCRYCKKAMVTHQGMERHQAISHAQEQCWFYYRKFVPSDTVINPEQVNLEDPSFINHVIHLPDQIHLCDFKLTDGSNVDLDQSNVPLNEPEIISMPENRDAGLLSELDSLYSSDEPSRDNGGCNDAELMSEVLHKSTEKKCTVKLHCKWRGCHKTYYSQVALAKHIEKNHVKRKRRGEYVCFWINCPRKSEPFSTKLNLVIHLRSHSGVKPFKCSFQGCNKAFSHLGFLKVHQKRHTGEKPYLCQFSNCLKRFPWSWIRDKHYKTHYNTCKWVGCQQTSYSEKSALAKHIKDHARLQRGKKFACLWINCPRKSKPYTSQHHLLVHMKVHTEEKSYKCPFQGCHKAFSGLKDLKIHQSRHTQKGMYLCQLSNCSKSFSSSSDKANHQARRHCKTKPYTCQVTGCSKKCADKNSFQKHMKGHTVDEQHEAIGKSIQNEEKEDDFELKKSSDNSDAKHQRTHYDTCKWEGCDQICDSQADLVKHVTKNHIELQRGEQFICFWITCPRKSKPYNAKAELIFHMRIHTGEKPYKCPFQGCNKTFSRSTNQQLHQRRHTGDKPYLCEYSNCLKGFSSLSDKITHQKTHNDAKTFVCQVTGCRKRYNFSRSLWKHMKNHTVDEQLEAKQKTALLKMSSNNSNETKKKRTHYDTLQCKWEDCYETYHSQADLAKHIEKNHVQIQKGKKFNCCWIDCPRKSKPLCDKNSLLRHMSLHSGERPYKCLTQGCNKAYGRPEDLKAHERRHTGERKHSCQFSGCSKSFFSVSARDQHERTLHYNIKRYACQVTGCLKKYTSSLNLANHMKSHTVSKQVEVETGKSVENEQNEDDFIVYHI